MHTMLQRTFITTGERIRTYLLVACALSVALNALCAIVFPRIQTPVDTPDVPHRIDIVHRRALQTPRPTVPPTPTPPPRASNRQPAPRSRPRTPVLATQPAVVSKVPIGVRPATNGSGPAAAGDAPLAAPAPPAVAGTPSPSCAIPNAEAAVENVVTPDYPDSARSLGLGDVTVLVEVALDARGALRSATIAQSSGNAAIDEAALRSARQSSYAPKIVNCAPVSGSYIFRASFE